MLDTHPDYYRAFGPYWWIMKKLFGKYMQNDPKWYCTGVYNAIDTQRYGFNDEWLEYCAAIYYFSQHSFDRPSLHIMKDSDEGEEVQYKIFDEDAPC